MSTVPQLLDQLAPLLVNVAPTHMAASQARGAAGKLNALASGYRHSGDLSRLERQLLAVADSLLSLAAAASRVLSGGSVPTWLPMQVEAGCLALGSCAMLARAAEQLPAASAYKIVAASGLALGPGTLLLTGLVQEAGAANAQHVPEPREVVGRAAANRMSMSLWDAQVCAVAECVRYLRQLLATQPAAAAAFASSTGKPAALLGWMLAMARAPSAACGDLSPADRHALTVNLVLFLEEVLVFQPFAQHRQQLAADAVLQQALANVLLTQCLPGTAAAVHADLAAGLPDEAASPRLLCMLPPVLMHDCLQSAVRQRLRAGGGVAAMQVAADMANTLPLPGSGEATKLGNATFVMMHSSVIQLLAIALVGFLRPAEAGEQHGLGSCSDGGSGSGSSSSSGSSDSRAAAAAAAGAAGSSDNHRQQAAWQLVALLPRLLAVVQALADSLADDDVPGWANVDSTCVNLATSLQILACLHTQPANPAQLAAWAEAGTASIRLQPALGQLQARLLRLGLQAAHGGGLHHLSVQLMQQLWRVPPQRLGAGQSSGASTSTAEQRRAATALWQLHSTFARLCHWLLGQDSPVLATADSHRWLRGVLCGLTLSVRGAEQALLACHTSDGHHEDPNALSEEARTRLAALSAVHAEALAALTAHSMAATAEGQQRAARQHLCAEAVMVSLPLIAAYNDSVVTQSLGPALQAGVAPVLQGPEGRLWLAGRLVDLAEAATNSFDLAVTLASSDLLALLLQAAMDMAGFAIGSYQKRAADLLDSWQATVAVLTDAASLAVDNAEVTGTPDSLVAQLKQGAHGLRQQQRQVLAGLQPDASPADRVAQLQQLVQPAAELAGLIQQWLHLRGTVVQELLIASQAAASRSCAYLRCANVAGQGGPAAGQGVGSARCSGCRAVWYCGTACSHADWRAGHKRVCKALAAERQEAKAARAAAAGQQAAAAGEGA